MLCYRITEKLKSWKGLKKTQLLIRHDDLLDLCGKRLPESSIIYPRVSSFQEFMGWNSVLLISSLAHSHQIVTCSLLFQSNVELDFLHFKLFLMNMHVFITYKSCLDTKQLQPTIHWLKLNAERLGSWPTCIYWTGYLICVFQFFPQRTERK